MAARGDAFCVAQSVYIAPHAFAKTGLPKLKNDGSGFAASASAKDALHQHMRCLCWVEN